MSLSLTHIPCPAGNSCTAFHCIFGHEKDQTPPSGIGNGNASNGLQDAEETSSNQDVPRKRFKTDSVQPTSPSKSTKGSGQNTSNQTLRDPHKDAGSQRPKSVKLETVSRPVSPPPLKRRIPSSHPSLSSTSKPLSSTNQSQTPPSQKQQPLKPKKTESLNPRLLKHSPASHEIRFKLLRMLHQEFLRLNNELKKAAKGDEGKLVLPEQDLIIRALDEEQETAVQKSAVYPNVMKNKVMQYKRMKVAQWKTQRVEERKKELQKLRPENASADTGKEIVTGLTPVQEVRLAKRLITPIGKLAEHGYVHVVPSEESIEKARQGVEASKGWEKCDRCQQRFQIFPGRREEDGALTSGGSCTFHWGKTYIPAKTGSERVRVPRRYQCCGEEIGDSAGCFTQSHHVYKATDPKRLASILNFAETPENPLAPTDRAVCFDCEMGYTVYGLELIRLTATSFPTGEVVLDVLVRPLGEVLDLNSRYSGVWPEDLAQAEPWTADDVKPSKSGSDYGSEEGEAKPIKKKLKIVSSPEVARDLLFSLISPTTPLIGHGLENDLNAVRVVHPTLIDTVLLYPHKAGLPYRYGLKMLMDTHLGRKIQQETGPKMLGHDSAEDARAAGDLVRLKIRNEWLDMQRKGWNITKGELVPPGKSGELTEEFLET
ncbi:Fc.00g097470.m01.CDS01 [Cosmosporella sp. VM-42]